MPLPESACVYCGNCIAVCPTGALMAKTEFDKRAEGTWDESRMTHDGHDLSVLRRRLHAAAPRRRRRDRQSDVAARELDHAGQSLHQGPLRLAVRAEPRTRRRTAPREWPSLSIRSPGLATREPSASRPDAAGSATTATSPGSAIGRRGSSDRARLQRAAVRRGDGDAGRPRGSRVRLQRHGRRRRDESRHRARRGREGEPWHRAADPDSAPPTPSDSRSARAALVSRTGCGLCGVETINDALRVPAPLSSHARHHRRRAVARGARAVAAADAQQRNEHRARRGVGAWPTASLSVVREDVGRHNALDKVLGAMARVGNESGRRVHRRHEPREL